MLLKKM